MREILILEWRRQLGCLSASFVLAIVTIVLVVLAQCRQRLEFLGEDENTVSTEDRGTGVVWSSVRYRMEKQITITRVSRGSADVRSEPVEARWVLDTFSAYATQGKWVRVVGVGLPFACYYRCYQFDEYGRLLSKDRAASAVRWRTLALSIFLHAIVWYCAYLVVVAWLRLWRRRRSNYKLRRGECPRCSYPVGESGVCSECGLSLKSN